MDEITRINTLIKNALDFNENIQYKNESFIVFGFKPNDFFRLIQFIRIKLNADQKIIVKDDFIRATSSAPLTVEISTDLSNCIFEKDFKIQNLIFKKNFTAKNVEFKGKTSFKKCVFQEKTRFHHSIFHTSVNFENTTFQSLIDFYEAQFKKPQSFFLTDFLDVAIFSNVIFHDQVQFLYNKVRSDSIISFESSTCKHSIDISRSNFWCRLQFWGIKIEKTIPSNVWLYQTDSIKEKEVLKHNKVYARLRESYRIIKHTFRTEGNYIEALNFQQKELLIFKKENSFINLRKFFHWLINFRKRIGKGGYKIETYLTVWFNYVSNNFGQSWSRGIIFTLIVNLIFFGLFVFLSDSNLHFSFESEDVLRTTKYYLQFLNITKWDYSPFGISIQESYHLGYLILFIGRIFIGYGYYQTIQAFRKFGKN